jgi:MFS family permease
MCHAAGHNFGSLAAVRVFLGALEAGCNPACMILFGMFYTREEQPLRMGIWIGFGGIANILSGIIGYGIGHVTGPLSVWKVMYLVSGMSICYTSMA